MWMRSKRSAQGSLQICRCYRVEVLVKLKRKRPGLNQRQSLSSQFQDIGIDRIARTASRSTCCGWSAVSLECAGFDIPVVIPLGLAASQADSVHHAITDKPVVTSWIRLKRVWTNAGVCTHKRFWYLTRYLEVIKRQLLNHGLVDAGQEHVLSEGILELPIKSG